LRGLYKRAILFGKSHEMVYEWYQFEQSFATAKDIQKATVYLAKNGLAKMAAKMPTIGK
jgi:hypothetical protein